MSINRDMVPYMLQQVDHVRTQSGASKEEWVDIRKIDVAVYETNDTRVVSSAIYNDSSHSGLTYYRNLKRGTNRLVRGNKVYNILSCKSNSRLTNLLLRVVDVNA